MATAICIALMAGGAAIVLPTETVTLGWTHSVEQTRWEEDYVASREGLLLLEARIETIGAGMQPPPSAVWQEGWWSYRPVLAPLPSITLANSSYAAGYSLCWDGQCHPLASLVPLGERATLTASTCSAPSSSAPRP